MKPEGSSLIFGGADGLSGSLTEMVTESGVTFWTRASGREGYAHVRQEAGKEDKGTTHW